MATITTTSSLSSMDCINVAPYPPHIPENKNKRVDLHDLPYARLGHLDLQEIYRLGHFNYNNNALIIGKKPRVNATIVSCSAITDMSKETMYSLIRKKYAQPKNKNEEPRKINYLCVASTIDQQTQMSRLNVQMILDNLIDTEAPFDYATKCKWSYQITRFDEHWNEYIKREKQYIESGRFKSVLYRQRPTWAHVLKCRGLDGKIQDSTATNKQMDEMTCRELVQQSEYDWVDGVEGVKFKRNREYYYNIKKIVESSQQIEQQVEIIKRRSPTCYDEFCWPNSFPDCTFNTSAKTNYWLDTSFFSDQANQTLIIISDSDLGQTSFALSLPGPVNYITETWSSSDYNNHARYNVIANIHWDKWDKVKNIPNKISLLTRQELCMARNGSKGNRTINAKKPSIVLVNREQAGSFLAGPRSPKEADDLLYWDTKKFIIELGHGEYYTKPKIPPQFNILDAEKYRTNVANKPEMIDKSRRWYKNHHEEETEEEEEIYVQDTVTTIQNEREMIVDTVNTNINGNENLVENIKRKRTNNKNVYIDWKPTNNISSNRSKRRKRN